ncbi:MAG: hypothetical protein U1C53_02180, partial [Candidatus Veblenbacteria bacterium]|nr:hypothetical protein [Candidatus Veblenbacteria bacterium]
LDGSASMVRERFPWARLEALVENIGFSRACNLGAREAIGEYLLFLNPDAEVVAGFFSDLERSFIHRPRAAIIGGHILNQDGSTQPSVRGFPGLWVGLLEATKLLSRFPGLAPRYLLPRFNYQETQAVDQVMGAGLAIRRGVWEALAGFDERFFVWFEEVDLCQRARTAGYQVWYDAHLNLVHAAARSFAQLPFTKRHYLYMTSLVRYLSKHRGVLAAALVWLVSRPAFAVTYLYDYVVSKHVEQG